MNTAFGLVPVATIDIEDCVECMYCPFILFEKNLQTHMRQHIVQVC